MLIQQLYPNIDGYPSVDTLFPIKEGNNRKEIVKANLRYIKKNCNPEEIGIIGGFLLDTIYNLIEKGFPFCAVIIQELRWFLNIIPFKYKNDFRLFLKTCKISPPTKLQIKLFYVLEADDWGDYYVCCNQLQKIKPNEVVPLCGYCGNVNEQNIYYKYKK